MKNFNKAQKMQLRELKFETDEEFMELMKKHVCLISDMEFESLIEEVNEAINNEECFVYSYDENFHSIASEYIYISHEAIDERFNYYGLSSLYMDSLGRGLVITMY